MDDHKLFSLKEAAATLQKCKDAANNNTLLVEAFELFNQETDRLERAYNSLKEEFALIHEELETANKNLIQKVAELEMMSFYCQSVVAHISQGLLFIDLNGDVITYNLQAESILGVPASRILSSNFWAHFQDAHFGFSMREALAHRTSPHTIFTTLKTEHTTKDIEVNTTFVDEEGDLNTSYGKEMPLKKFQGIIILIRDITNMKRLQAIAHRNDRLKELGEMAALVAHEIRNPLGGIKGFASLLKRDLQNEPRYVKMTEYIIEGTDTLNRLVTNVLNYSRPIQLEIKTIDLPILLQELKAHFEADTQLSQSISIELESTFQTLELKVDPQLIKCALLNLMVNAKQAMSEKGGTLRLFLDKNAEEVAIVVIDEGCGIAPEDLEKIFSPFFTTKPEGNGFGLAEVSKIIQAHNGSIQVKSSLNCGTEIILKLPLFNE